MDRRQVARRRLAALTLVVIALAALAAFVVQGLDLAKGVDEHGAKVGTLEIRSRAAGRKLETTVVVPKALAGVRRPPLLVFLHGRGGEAGSEASQAFYAALDALGSRAPVVAFPDGDDHSYWHDRGDGRWARYVTKDVIPAVARHYGTDRRRVAIGGISMGGFGAFDIARLNPGRFCAVGGHSPALWRTAGETAPGAFDDAGDFARHDVIGAARANGRPFGDMPVWIDGGTEDPFRPGIDALTAALRAGGTPVSAHAWPGGHEGSYWSEHWPAYARFYARALSGCRR